MTGDLPAKPAALAAALVAWFDENRRALPWRTERTPYRVWLSEVMLQQTRVAVVDDYFRRFLQRFPDVRTLAAAGEDEVLAAWSGLGYYSRGRNLHKAARAVVDDHGGRFPATPEALRTLPGVGEYTAAAVASLAFGARAAVVDGNVLRVLARLCDDHGAVDQPAVRSRMHARAFALVDGSPRGSAPVNEGLMELGALACTPKSPSCAACPWSGACRAKANGTAAALPVKSPKRARKALHVASVILVDERGRVWLERRASEGLFGGLLEPPSAELLDPGARAVESAWLAILESRGVARPRTKLPAPVVVERTLTHRDLRFSVLRLALSSAKHPGAPWVDDVAGAALSTATRAVLRAVGAHRVATRADGSLSGSEP